VAAGARALKHQIPTLLVDFNGLKGFSARQIMETLGNKWPNLRTIRLAFPGADGELYPEQAARLLDLKTNRTALASLIIPHIHDSKMVGLPAILGIAHPGVVFTHMEQLLGVPIFEIPTMLPTVAGIRMREAFEQRLPAKGVRTLYRHKVITAMVLPDDQFLFTVDGERSETKIQTRNVILASGRFFGKGLRADRNRIRESIFDLPVVQPAERTLWHHKDLLHVGGHPINRAGLATDHRFRPVDSTGKVIHDNLYAVGSILGHQDWVRQKCGSGLAIASAYGAIRAMVDNPAQ
jgi:glycerol-3-phosphate dehydrogenase subunit B